MNDNEKCTVCFINETDDPTYENWLARYIKPLGLKGGAGRES